MKSLVIVESPTKANTIGKFLGSDFVVLSTMGHIIDLPEGKMGVNIEKDFEPNYVVISKRKKILTQLKKEAKDKEMIYVATDPDREGEAIGWHIKTRLGEDKKFSRVIFHEITPQAIKEAFANPLDFDLNKIYAQQARRILDRLVGYFLSPLLWKKVARGLSAGRVQSVALRLIVEREKEILNFIPQEYWQIEGSLKKKKSQKKFLARLEKFDDKNVEIRDKSQADSFVKDLKDKQFIVENIEEREKKRYASAPFITSTLQQEAFNKLKFTAGKTMFLAQQLYEGIALAELGPIGLITYMRTDSTKVATSAIEEVRNYILKKYGKDYLPATPNVYKVKKTAQEAHEAIRPTAITRTPEEIKAFLTPEQYKLYSLIYNRFIASQMASAVYQITAVSIKADSYLFVARGSKILFNGFTVVYKIADEDEADLLPSLSKEEVLDLMELIPSQHFTKPPAHFSEGSLIKTLEEEGVGRPSTYAPIIQTLVSRDYVRRIKGYFYAQELGIKVNDLLIGYFSKIIDIKFTATMEERLDDIEEGKGDWVGLLKDFYQSFKESLEFAEDTIKKEVIETNDKCDKCGKPMVIKWGRRGKFLSCSDFPRCKNAKSISTGITCPSEGCGGYLVERRSKKGMFYGCSNFPKCRHTTGALPQEKQTTQNNS